MSWICFSIRELPYVNFALHSGPEILYAHLLVDEFQTSVDCHDSLGLVLLQKHRADLLVDVRIVVEEVEFLYYMS